MDVPGASNGGGFHVVSLLDDRFKDTAFGKLARIHKDINSDNLTISEAAAMALIRWNHGYTRNRWSQADQDSGDVPRHLLVAHSYGDEEGLRISAVLHCGLIKYGDRDTIGVTLKNMLEYGSALGSRSFLFLHERAYSLAGDDEAAIAILEQRNESIFPRTWLHKVLDDGSVSKQDPVVVVPFENLNVMRVWVRGTDQPEDGDRPMDNWKEVGKIKAFRVVLDIIRAQRAQGWQEKQRVGVGDLLFPEGHPNGTHYLPSSQWCNAAVWGDKTERDGSRYEDLHLCYGAKMTGVVATSLTGSPIATAKRAVAFGRENKRITSSLGTVIPVYGAAGQKSPSLGADPSAQETAMTLKSRNLNDPHTIIWFDALFEFPVEQPLRNQTWKEMYTDVKRSTAEARAQITNLVSNSDANYRLLAAWLAVRAAWLRNDVEAAVKETLRGTAQEGWPYALLPPSTGGGSVRFYNSVHLLFRTQVLHPFRMEIQGLPPIEPVEEEEEEGGEEGPMPVVVPPVSPPASPPASPPREEEEEEPAPPLPPSIPPPPREEEPLPPLPPRPEEEEEEEGGGEEGVFDLEEQEGEKAPDPTRDVMIQFPTDRAVVFQPPERYRRLDGRHADEVYAILQRSMANGSVRAFLSKEVKFSWLTTTRRGRAPADVVSVAGAGMTSDVYLGSFGRVVLGREKFDLPRAGDDRTVMVFGWADPIYVGRKPVERVGIPLRTFTWLKKNNPSVLSAPLNGTAFLVMKRPRDLLEKRSGILRLRYESVYSDSGKVVAHLIDASAGGDDVIGIMGGFRVSHKPLFRISYFFVRVIVPR